MIQKMKMIQLTIVIFIKMILRQMITYKITILKITQKNLMKIKGQT